jgi:hypothetical protein
MAETNLIIANPRLKHSSRIHSKRMGGETVLLDAESGNYYTLNSTASELWFYCAEPRKVEDLVQFLCSCYGITLSAAKADIQSCLEQLLEENLLELEGC